MTYQDALNFIAEQNLEPIFEKFKDNRVIILNKGRYKTAKSKNLEGVLSYTDYLNTVSSVAGNLLEEMKSLYKRNPNVFSKESDVKPQMSLLELQSKIFEYPNLSKEVKGKIFDIISALKRKVFIGEETTFKDFEEAKEQVLGLFKQFLVEQSEKTKQEKLQDLNLIQSLLKNENISEEQVLICVNAAKEFCQKYQIPNDEKSLMVVECMLTDSTFTLLKELNQHFSRIQEGKKILTNFLNALQDV